MRQLTSLLLAVPIPDKSRFRWRRKRCAGCNFLALYRTENQAAESGPSFGPRHHAEIGRAVGVFQIDAGGIDFVHGQRFGGVHLPVLGRAVETHNDLIGPATIIVNDDEVARREIELKIHVARKKWHLGLINVIRRP